MEHLLSREHHYPPPTKIQTLRGERMLRKWTLRGNPVTFSWVEVILALWKATWLPGHYVSDNYSVSTDYLASYTPLLSSNDVAVVIGGVGIAHVSILMAAWFGIARPPRKLRLTFNVFACTLYAYIAGVAVGLGAMTTAGPYVVLFVLAVSNLQRAVRNGKGYRAIA